MCLSVPLCTTASDFKAAMLVFRSVFTFIISALKCAEVTLEGSISFVAGLSQHLELQMQPEEWAIVA